MKVLLVSVFGLAVMVIPFSGNVEAAKLKEMKASAYINLNSAFSPLSPIFSGWNGGTVKIDNGNHYGWFNSNGNGRPQSSVPIPGTLLLFGGGFAGFAAWRRRVDRRRRVHQADRPIGSLANHSVLQCKQK